MKEKKSKVLVVSTSRQTRGGITSVVRAHESCPHWQEYRCHWIETHIDKGKFAKLWYMIRSILKFVFIAPAYQIVHIHFSEPASAIRKSFYFGIAYIYRKKIILHFHAFSPDSTLNGRLSILYRWMFNHADSIVVLSGYWRREVEKLIGTTNKIKIIFNPCPAVKLSQFEKEKYILFAGTMNERKGYADLIAAFARIAAQHLDWKLVFAGNGELLNAQSLAAKFGIVSQVQLIGWISGSQKNEVFSKASVFCLPSYAEGFPMAVLDAWAYGLPVVCTPVGGLPEIVQDGENALMFDYGDIAVLSEKLDLIIRDSVLRSAISAKSAEMAHTIFDLQVIGRQVGELYKELSR